jgi:Homing endonuclease associated repeat
VLGGDEPQIDHALELLFATMQADAALIRGTALSQRSARELEEVGRVRDWIERESRGRSDATRAQVAELKTLLRRWFTNIAFTVQPGCVVIAATRRRPSLPAGESVQVSIDRAAWTRRVRPHRRQLIHGFWGKAEIIGALQAFADRHGRSPTWVDWARAGPNHPQARTLYRHFKSWNHALRRAGLEAVPPPVHYSWSRREIVTALQAWTRKSGRPPMSTEWARARPDHPSSCTVLAHFGHWEGALSAAGLEPRRRPPRRSQPWRPKEILEALENWTGAHGQPPASFDWLRAAPEHPQAGTVRKYFGSWQAALAAAGVTPAPSHTG